MSLPRSVAEVLKSHVTLEYEAIDRMYLNAYVPRLQTAAGVAAFFRHHRALPFASSALMAPMTRVFVQRIEQFVQQHRLPVVQFAKGQRKDDVTQQYLARFTQEEGVLFVGKAQEKAWVFRTERRHNPTTGAAYPWIVRGSALVNHYYFYCVDRDFGPFFLKFCSYFPYTAKLCIFSGAINVIQSRRGDGSTPALRVGSEPARWLVQLDRRVDPTTEVIR